MELSKFVFKNHLRRDVKLDQEDAPYMGGERIGTLSQFYFLSGHSSCAHGCISEES